MWYNFFTLNSRYAKTSSIVTDQCFFLRTVGDAIGWMAISGDGCWRCRSFGLFGVSLSKELIRRYEINKEVNKLKAEVTTLEGRNKALADLIQLYNSPSYQEQQARAKLNLRKPGEKSSPFPKRS